MKTSVRKWKYHKIPKIILIFFKGPFWGAYIQRGLSMEGNLHFKIDWASLIVWSKFTIFALFYFVFECNFPRTNPWGAYIWRGDLTEGFLHYRFEGHIFGGAYTLRGSFSEFYGIAIKMKINHNTEIEKIKEDKRRWQKQTKVDEEKQNKKVLSESISNWLPIYNNTNLVWPFLLSKIHHKLKEFRSILPLPVGATSWLQLHLVKTSIEH